MTDIPSFAVCVPTLNPGPGFATWLETTRGALNGARLVVVDSSSDDETTALARAAGAEVVIIERTEFDHGGTRSRILHHLNDVEVVIFLTQDALPYGTGSLTQLARCFTNGKVGAAFGRQLPHDDATLIAAHARLFNYPSTSRLVSLRDTARLGIKAAFLSNSFAAYRRSAMMEIGGFAENVILSEDMLAGARLLKAGWSLAYCAEACVKHSHNYSLMEEFRRYFDIGVFHCREPWLREWLGSAEGEGARFVRSELGYLLKRAPWRIPEAGLRTLLKYAGYRLGTMEGKLPLRLKRSVSMHRHYWSEP